MCVFSAKLLKLGHWENIGQTKCKFYDLLSGKKWQNRARMFKHQDRSSITACKQARSIILRNLKSNNLYMWNSCQNCANIWFTSFDLFVFEMISVWPLISLSFSAAILMDSLDCRQHRDESKTHIQVTQAFMC